MKQNIIYPVMFALLVVLGSFGVSQAYADYGYVKSTPPIEYGESPVTNTIIEKKPVSSNVCVFSPIDIFMDTRIITIVTNEIKTNGIVPTIVSRDDQLTGYYSCSHIISLDRAINENYRFTIQNTKYTVSGTTATIFAYETNQPFNPNAQPNRPMINWNCEIQAHAQKYFSNYNFGYSEQSGYCNPFTGINWSQVGEYPPAVIEKSVDNIMKIFGV